MKLIATKCAMSDKLDRLTFVRSDGTRSETDMPRQGVLPHDLIHYVVEVELELRGGFLSLVAQGADAGFAMDMAHNSNNRDAERSAIQAEAIVEALQSQLWSGTYDHSAFIYGLQVASEARGVEPPSPPSEAIGSSLFLKAQDLNHRWSSIQPRGTLELLFPDDAA